MKYNHEEFVAECQCCKSVFNEEEFNEGGGEMCHKCHEFYCDICIIQDKHGKYVCLECNA